MAERERSWIAESLLIVISILVAFAIDAWWRTPRLFPMTAS